MNIKKLFLINSMIKPDQVMGELPQTNEAYKTFLRIAWPSIIETLLVSLVGSVDTMMVGTLGEGAIAAVGITNQPKFILLAMIFSLNIGITAVTARRKGQGDQAGANHTLRVGFILSLVISLFMSILGFYFAKPILLFVGAEEAYLSDAMGYFHILMYSIPFQAINLTINAAQRGCGRTKISMYTNVASNVVNVIFNYLLINGIGFFPKLGVRGAAIATAMGAFVAFLISLATLLRKDGYLSFYRKASWRIHKTVLEPIFKVCSSAFVEQVFMRIGFLAYNVIIAKLGTTEYATHIICMSILSLSFSLGDGLSIASSALVGQNLGAKRPDISIVYGKTGQRISFIASSFVFLIFVFGRTFLVSLFSGDTAVIALGSGVLILAALGTHAQSSQMVLSGCLRGAGDTVFVAITSMISITIVRPLLTWLLCFPLGFGLYGAWIALFIDQYFRLATSMKRFSSGKWANIVL